MLTAPNLAPQDVQSDQAVRVEWHDSWSPAIDEAFAEMPYDFLMDPEVVRRLWHHSQGRGTQRIAIARGAADETVGIIPLRKREFGGRLSWQLLTQLVQPYARFHVVPGYTDAVLAALGTHIACDSVLFHEPPKTRSALLLPAQSWVVSLPGSYAELMRATRYREDRRVRRHAARFDVFEDRYEDLPIALAHWAVLWASRGSMDSATRYREMLVSYEAMAEQGRLKTFSLYDSGDFAAIEVVMIGPDALYGLLTVSKDEYRKFYPGIYGVLLALEWACDNGYSELDLGPGSYGYKENWAIPQTRAYRLTLGPLGSRVLARARQQVFVNYSRLNRRLARLEWRVRGQDSLKRRLGVTIASDCQGQRGD